MVNRIAVFSIFACIGAIIWQSCGPEVNTLDPQGLTETEQQLEINMPVDIDGHQPISPEEPNIDDAWKNENLRMLFDFYVAYYEQSEQKMWQEFNQYCLPLVYCVEFTRLFQRYLIYKMRLQNLDTEHLGLASEFADRLDKLGLLRIELFSLHEIKLLFDNEETWDRHAIERLRINQDLSLNKQQKTQLVKQQLEQLPEPMKLAVVPTQQLRKVKQIVSSTVFNSSDEYNQLAAEFGGDAAQRLVAVNQSQNSWLKKIQVFQQRSSDLKQQFNQGSTDYNQAVTQLKQQMFEDNEKKRLQVYLSNPQLNKSSG